MERFYQRILFFCIMIFYLSGSALAQNLTTISFKEDLEFFRKNFPQVHKNAYHTLSEKEFHQGIDDLISKVDEMDQYQLFIGLMKIISSVGDGHTWINWWVNSGSGYFPLKFHEFADGIYLVHAIKGYEEILGKKLIKIGNIKVEEAINELMTIASGDNRFDRRRRIINSYLTKPGLLYGSGLTGSMDKLPLTFVDATGNEIEIEVDPINSSENSFTFGITPMHPDMISGREMSSNPLYMERSSENFWIAELPEEKTAYLRFLRVLNDNKKGQTVNNLASELREVVSSKNIEKLIIDVRFNGGGNNQLTRNLLHEIIKAEKVNRPGKLFLLINDYTFSAAGHFTTYIEQHTDAILVGEPTAFSPNHYGDPRNFSLPNTGWTISASSLYWQNSLPWDNRQFTEPDYFIDLSFDDYKNNRDPVLEFALNFDPTRDSFDQNIRKAILNKNKTKASEIYNGAKANQLYKFQNFEGILNQLGYQLLFSGKIEEAILAFEVNMEQNPKSTNVYDSLAEAYMANNQKELAVTYYTKVLEMNPGPALRANAESKLKELKN